MVRIPLVEDSPAKESCIDLLVDSLKQEPASTQCVFSCQAGLGRTTLGLLVVWVNSEDLTFIFIQE